jgi:hypothetical protein
VDLDGLGVHEALGRLVGVGQAAAHAAGGQEHVDLAASDASDVVGELLEQALARGCRGGVAAVAVPELVARRRGVDAVQGAAGAGDGAQALHLQAPASVPPSDSDVGEKLGAEWTGKIARRPVKSTESPSRSIMSSM